MKVTIKWPSVLRAVGECVKQLTIPRELLDLPADRLPTITHKGEPQLQIKARNKSNGKLMLVMKVPSGGIQDQWLEPDGRLKMTLIF